MRRLGENLDFPSETDLETDSFRILLGGCGQGPTAFAGADVYSVGEPTPQKISTGRPSQPQRPPGSMHEVLLLGVMHMPWLRQPTVKPQR